MMSLLERECRRAISFYGRKCEEYLRDAVFFENADRREVAERYVLVAESFSRRAFNAIRMHPRWGIKR